MRRSLTGSAVLLAAWAFAAPGTALAAPAPAPAPLRPHLRHRPTTTPSSSTRPKARRRPSLPVMRGPAVKPGPGREPAPTCSATRTRARRRPRAKPARSAPPRSRPAEAGQGVHYRRAAPALPQEKALRAAAADRHHGQRSFRPPLHRRRRAQLLDHQPHGGRYHGHGLHRQQDLAVHQHPLPGERAVDRGQGALAGERQLPSTTPSTARSRCSTAC